MHIGTISAPPMRRRGPAGLAGFFDFGSIFSDAGNLFSGMFDGISNSGLPTSVGGSTSVPAGVPANNFQYFVNSIGTYLQSRDLSKLNRTLAQQGISPLTQQSADYYAAQQRSGGIPAWLPWIAVAGLGYMLVAGKKR